MTSESTVTAKRRARLPHLALVAALLVLGPVSRADVTPPAQPDSGPGGRDYEHRDVRAELIVNGNSRYWLFEPAAPSPASAPVLAFLSGVATGEGPYIGSIEFNVFADAYRAMFEHLARKGITVIFPAYGWLGSPLANYEPNAAEAIRLALEELGRGSHVRPRAGAFAIGGHSFGGLAALTIANRHQELGLPRPRAIIGQEPALIRQIERVCTDDPGHSLCGVTIPVDFSGIHPDTINVVIVGGQARLEEMRDTLEQWDLPQVPADREALLFINDDRRGTTPLIANHLSNGAHPSLPLAGFELDALDWYGYWKPTEAALDLAFDGIHGEYVIGESAAARYMGLWSDGVPVRPMSTARQLMRRLGRQGRERPQRDGRAPGR